MQYDTFDLSISSTNTPCEYLLFAQSSEQGEATGKTKIDIHASSIVEQLSRLENDIISPTDLQNFGSELYQSLFVDKINLLFNRALGKTLGDEELGLRLRLRINSPELDVLPWEFLYSPENHLFFATSVKTPLSRYINLTEPIRSLTCTEKLRILTVIPKNSGLDTTAERQTLEEIAKRLNEKIVIDFLEGEATESAIRNALRQNKYQVFHYAGHGDFDNHESIVYLDHETRMTAPFEASLFAQFFMDYPSMRLVILNSCKGAKRSSHKALVGAAPQIVLRGVPAVIAMQFNIENDDAILFATEFYAEICGIHHTGQIEAAISIARKALLQARPTSFVFGNPVLYLRSQDGKIFDFTHRKIKNDAAENKSESTAKVQLTIDIEFDRFDPKLQRLLQFGLAKFLEISSEAVKIISIKAGSVKVTIELPTESAEKLLSAYKRKDSAFFKSIAPLIVLTLHQEMEEQESIKLESAYLLYTKPEKFSNTALVKLLVQEPQNENAWKEFDHRFHKYIYLTIASVCKRMKRMGRELSKTSLEDLVQQFYYGLVKNNLEVLKSFRGNGENSIIAFLKTFAIRTVQVNLASAHATRRRTSSDETLSSGEHEMSHSEWIDVFEQIEEIEKGLQNILKRNKNKERDKLIFEYYLYYGLDAKAISLLPDVNLSSKRVRNIISSIKVELQKYLSIKIIEK